MAIIKSASSITDIDGSGFEYFAGPLEGGLVRCKSCFNRLCENKPNVAQKNPFKAEKFLKFSGIEANTLGCGLIVTKEKMEQYLSGHNQSWFSFKRMLLDHAGCSTTRNGGLSHYQFIVWQKRKNVIRKAMTEILCNQLSAALMVVKVKTATLHYESMISFLHSCGAEVGNIGHGRKQLNHMLRVFQAHIWKKKRF